MIQMRRIRLVCVGFLVGGFACVPAAIGASPVDELMKRIPDDVIAFVGASGGDALKGDFEKTALGRIWNDPSVRTFCQSVKTEVVTKAQVEDPNLSQKVDLACQCFRLALSRPFLVCLARVPAQEGPGVVVFAVLDAGNRKAEIAACVNKLEERIGLDKIADIQAGALTMRGLKDVDKPGLYWGWRGNSLVLAVNDCQGAVTKRFSHPRSATPANWGAVLGAGDAFAAYGDIQAIRQVVGSLLREEEGEEASNVFTSVLWRLGLNETKSFRAKVSFVQSEIVVHTVVEMPAPATGIFVASKPIDPAWFGVVDVRAVSAGAVNWDIAGLYDTIMGVVQTASPLDAYPKAQKAISDFELRAGMRIRDELLASLAGPAVSYSLPMGITPDVPQGGRVMVARLRDAQRFEGAVTSLGEFAVENAQGMLQIGSQKRDDGRTVHVWTMPALAVLGMMPTWSVVGDHVIIASNMQLHELAVGQYLSREAGGKSLLDVESFKKATAGLPPNLTSLTYIDSQVRFNQYVAQMQQAWPILTMALARQGVKLPVLLPSLAEVGRDMRPSLRCSYYGPDGFHSLYCGPGIEAGRMSVSSMAMGMGILMPALARVRQLAFRMTSGTNLSVIGKACLVYADEHDGKLPPDLQTLVAEVQLSAKCLESKLKPDGFKGPSYIYVPGQDLSMHPGNVVAYENPEFCVEGVNVLFLDSHAEFMRPEPFHQALKATYARLKRPLPMIRFRDDEASQN
ncbi:MAG: hypothetical protein ABFD90_05790 [Phycisphaerales bacterium]